MKICKRYSDNEDFSRECDLKVGMCITGRVVDDSPLPGLPYPHFVYIVESIKEDSVFLIDTANNNSWSIPEEELQNCELVSEFHRNNNQVDCEYINRVLTGE